MPKKLFPQKSPPAPAKKVTSNPKHRFYLDFGFITKAEYAQLLLGNIALNNHVLPYDHIMNLNASGHITPVKTGETVKIYRGRADHVLRHQLFGVPLPEAPE